MTTTQLKYLKEFKKSNIPSSTKQSSEDINELILFLKSYNIIHKKSSSFEISDGFLFDKLLELKSIPDFKLWYSQKDKVIFNNDYRNSTIGQINQSSTLPNNSLSNNLVKNSKVDSSKNFLIKFWELISQNKLISSIIFVIILYIIKKYFNIDLG